jgi:murein DD-endopeptidase MepM/ murein hydrolase activator NlpD
VHSLNPKVKKPSLKLLLLSFSLLIIFATGSVLADNNNQLKTIYHVYVDGDKIGTVNDQDLIEEIIEKKSKLLQAEYSHLNLTVKEDLVVVPEKVFTPIYNNAEVLTELKEKITIAAQATALVVDGEKVGYVNNNDEASQVINQMLSEFAPAEVISKLDNLEYKNPDKEITSLLNEPTIIDVTLSENVSLLEEKIAPEKIITIEQAIELLKKGTLTDTIHTVKSGDYLGKIASKYNLSVKEVLSLNPEITEKTILQIGDKLIVTDYEPYVKVTVTEAVAKEEFTSYETEYQSSSKMYKGESKVIQYGVKGKKRVDYVITKENGKEVKKEIVNTEVIKKPINKIVVKGTKVIPSRGTGEFGWPTYGGVITSKLGWRWGAYHKGIDIAGVSNRTIRAVDNGTVVFASYGWNGGYGTKIIINHNNGYKTIYAHLSKLYVSSGQVVRKGQAIGVMGNTGNSTGTHLHIELYKYSTLLNPLKYFRRY